MKVLHSQLKFIITFLLVLLFVRESSSQIITSNRVIGETITDGVLSLSQGGLSNVVSISSPPGVNLVFTESFGVNGQVQTPSTNFETLQANNVATASITAASLTSKTSLTTNTLFVSGEATASGLSVVSQAKLTGQLSVGGNVNVVKQAVLEGKVVATNLDASDLVVRTGVILGGSLNVTKSATLADVDSSSLNSLKITTSSLTATNGVAVSSKSSSTLSNNAVFTDMLTVSNPSLRGLVDADIIVVNNLTKAADFESNYLFVNLNSTVKGDSTIGRTLAVIRNTEAINHSTISLDIRSDAGFTGFVKVIDTVVSGNLRAQNSSWFGSNFSSPFLDVFNTYNTTTLTVKAVTGVAGNLEVQDSAFHLNELEVQATGFFAEVFVAKNFTTQTLNVAKNSISGSTQVFNLTVVDNINVANLTDVNSLPRLFSTKIESTTLTSAFGKTNTFQVTEQTKLWGNVTLLPNPLAVKNELNVYLNSTFTKVSEFSGPSVLVENYLSANDSIIKDLQVDTFFDTHTAQGYAATLQNLTVYGRATLNIIEVKKYVDSNLLVIGTVTSSEAFYGPEGVFGSTATKETEVTRLSTIDNLQTNTAMANYAVVQDFDALSSRVESFNTNVLGNAEFLNLNVTTLLWANSSVLSSVDLVGGLTTGPLAVTDSSTINGFFYSASASVFGGDTIIRDLTVIKAFTTNTLTATFKITMNRNSLAHPFRVTTASGSVPFYLFREGSAIIGWSGTSQNTFHGLTSFETLDAGIPRFNTLDGCLTCTNPNLEVGVGANDVDGTLKLWNPLNGNDILQVETSAGVNVLSITNDGQVSLVAPLIQFKVDTFSVQKGSYPAPVDSFFDVYSINPDPLTPTRLAGLLITNDGGMEVSGNLMQLDGITLVENVDSFVVSTQGFFGFVGPSIVANPLQVISSDPASGFPSISIIRNFDIIFDTNNVLDYVGQPDPFTAPPLTNGLNNAPTAYAFRLKTNSDTFSLNAAYMRGHLHLTSVEHFVSRVTTPTLVNFGDSFMFYYVTVPAPPDNIGRWTLETLNVNLAGVLAQDVGKVIILFGVEGIEIGGHAPMLQLAITGGTIAGASNLYLDSGVNSIFSAPVDPHAACNLNIKADVFAHTFIVTGANTLEILGLSAANVDPGNSC